MSSELATRGSTPQSLEEEQSLLLADEHVITRQRERPEVSSLLGPRNWKAHPYWLIPFVFTVDMARGATLAPRIQVFNAIACRALHNSSPLSMDCSDSEVAARAASIQAVVMTTTSVLSAVTTGFWSRLGDTYGRKPIFIVFLTGAICFEFGFILAMKPNTIFSRYAEQLVLLGSVIEGLAGGIASFHGLLNVYISDCTRHGSRSKIFSAIQGMAYIGLSLGPWLTGIIVPHDSSTDPFFIFGIIMMTLTMIYMLVLCPESHKRSVNADSSHRANDGPCRTPVVPMIHSYFLKFLAALASPIAMFAPRRLRGLPERTSYSLTLVGLALFIHRVSHGSYASKYLFAEHQYSWTTTQLGHYLSLLWIMNAINLLIILPIIISYFKPKTSTVPGVPLNPRDLAAELRFDRHLAVFSLALDGASNLLVALTNQNSQEVFVLLSCVSSFTSAGDPSLHSLGAVCLHACGYSSEIGALFGAKAILSAVASMIAPSIFALTYTATVANFPQAIFVLAAVLAFTSVVLLVAVRISIKDIAAVHAAGAEEEIPLNGILPEDEDEA